MTPRAFDLARLSVERLLDNIADRTLLADSAITAVRQSMTSQDNLLLSLEVNDLHRGLISNQKLALEEYKLEQKELFSQY